jgi:hypothetical protein
MATTAKCPNCGGDVLDGYCYACGIEVAMPEAVTNETYQNTHAAYAEPQADNVYPNIEVTDDIIYDKPTTENFYTKYNRMTFGEKMGKYWWFVLLSLIAPMFWLCPAIWAACIALFDRTPGRGKFAAELALLALIGVIILG